MENVTRGRKCDLIRDHVTTAACPFTGAQVLVQRDPEVQKVLLALNQLQLTGPEAVDVPSAPENVQENVPPAPEDQPVVDICTPPHISTPSIAQIQTHVF